jgi:hypothetical protein
MSAFEQVTADEFDDAVERNLSSQKFKEQYARFAPFEPSGDDHCFVHRGSLTVSGNFTAPGFFTLIIGDLTVDRLVDLDNPEGFDEGGLFIVIGNVSCRVFSGHYGKCSFVDGNLVASELILNAYEDSSLLVTGDLRTKFFYGEDICAQVGGVAEMEYGEGYCLPIGYRNAAEQAIRARHDTESHLVLDPKVLNDRNSLKMEEALPRLRRGKSILRSDRNIGVVLKPKLSKLGKARLAELTARAEAGETITEIDLRESELRFVPEDIRRFSKLRKLILSKNEVKDLPDWIGEFKELEILEAEDCGLATIPLSIARLPSLRSLSLEENGIIELPFDENTYSALEKLRIGQQFGREPGIFLAGLDLAQFPNLRFLKQQFPYDYDIEFGSDCDLWNAPRLEYLEINNTFETRMPSGLAKATGLKGLKCDLTSRSLGSALELLPRLANLQVFTVVGGSDLRRTDVLALAEALPNLHIVINSCRECQIDRDDPRYALRYCISDHLRFGRYTEAAAAGEQLLADLDFAKPRFERTFQDGAIHDWLFALNFAAAEEHDPAERRNKCIKAAQLADRILDVLPKSGEICGLAGLGWLRWNSLLAQANRCIHQENPDLKRAKTLFDLVQSETGDVYNVSKERTRSALREAGVNV